MVRIAGEPERPSAARRFWSPSAGFADRRADRRVTFLELFFDLVFVVAYGRCRSRTRRVAILVPTYSDHDTGYAAASAG
jgi:hypothetical protein